MKVGKAVRVTLDIALSIMIVFEMLIQFTGEFLHEVVGFAFFATVVAHLLLQAAWMKKTARNAKSGKLTARRTALAVIGCLLALAMVVLGVSSVAISGILASAGFVWPLGAYSLWVSVHTFSSYALCALVVVHLAMHWAFLASAFKVSYDPSRRRAIATGVNAVAALGVLALGVAAADKVSPQTASSAMGATGAEGGSANASAGASSGSANGAGASPDSASSSAGTAGAEADSASDTGTSPAGAGNTTSSGKSNRSRGKRSDGATPGISSSGGSTESSGDSGASGGSSSGSNSSSSGTSGSNASNGSGTLGGSGSGASGGNGSASSAICTLCRKQCPLSAPKCDKPYQEGLL